MALNQKLSVNVKAKEATKALPRIIIELLFPSSFEVEIIFFSKMVKDQNINKTVNALEKTDIMLTIKAILSGLNANIAKNAPSI